MLQTGQVAPSQILPYIFPTLQADYLKVLRLSVSLRPRYSIIRYLLPVRGEVMSNPYLPNIEKMQHSLVFVYALVDA